MQSSDLYWGLGAVPQLGPGSCVQGQISWSEGQGAKPPEAGKVFIFQSLIFDVHVILYITKKSWNFVNLKNAGIFGMISRFMLVFTL